MTARACEAQNAPRGGGGPGAAFKIAEEIGVGINIRGVSATTGRLPDQANVHLGTDEALASWN
jgi:hypothetical protein